jgi:hypothetical protein
LYDDLLLLFCDAIFIFVINFRAKSSSLGTYDENGDFVTDDIPFCDESERRHEQIVTDCNISSSVPQLRRLLRNSGELFCCRRSSLAEGEHTIAFVSSIPFHFAIQSTVSWSFPSNPLFSSLSLPVLFKPKAAVRHCRP